MATAIGPMAAGAFAIGVLAIRRLAIRRVLIESAKLKSLEIEDLTVTGSEPPKSPLQTPSSCPSPDNLCDAAGSPADPDHIAKTPILGSLSIGNRLAKVGNLNESATLLIEVTSHHYR